MQGFGFRVSGLGSCVDINACLQLQSDGSVCVCAVFFHVLISMLVCVLADGSACVCDFFYLDTCTSPATSYPATPTHRNP